MIVRKEDLHEQREEEQRGRAERKSWCDSEKERPALAERKS